MINFWFCKRYVLLTMICISLSCQDNIELEIPKGTTEAIVIEGVLVKAEQPLIQVKIQNFFVFDGTSRTVDVRSVSLIDLDGQSIELHRDAIGEYSHQFGPNDEYSISYENSYKIRVEIIDGRIIESDYEPIQSVSGNNKVNLTIEDREFYLERTDSYALRPTIIVNLETELNNVKNNPRRYRWSTELDYKFADTPDYYEMTDPKDPTKFLKPKICYINDKLSNTETFIFDGYAATADDLSFSAEIYSGRVDDFRLADTSYFSVAQESLSEGAYTYFYQIAEVIDRQGSMFEPPAGKVSSNFINVNDHEEEIYGYFYATERIYQRYMVTPDMVNNPSRLCPREKSIYWRPGDCSFAQCCDCLKRENSTLVKPDFWAF